MVTLKNLLLSPTLSTSDLTVTLEVLSNISEIAKSETGSALALPTHITSILAQIVHNNLASPSSFSLSSSKITIQIQSLDPSADTTITIPSSNTRIILPANMHSSSPSLKLVTILYKENIYNSIA